MRQERPHRTITLFEVVAFTAMIGLVSALWGYSYGDGNQVEQLPLVLRALDRSYLVADFFTSVASGFGPRFYYSQFLALLARIVPLPSLSLALTIIVSWAVALISALMARDMFHKSNVVAIFAACAVMSVSTFGLGYNASFVSRQLHPSTLAFPLVLLAVWMTLKDRPALAMTLSGVASLVHGLLGLEVGGVLLVAWIVPRVLSSIRDGSRRSRSDLLTLLKAGLILAAFAAVTIIPELTGPHIGSAEFYQILAVFRHPHHYIPSSFPRAEYAQAACFFVATGIVWCGWRKSNAFARRAALSILTIAVTALLLCVGGYLFVEVLPSRLWITAQTFRLLILPKWLGVMLVAGAAASCVSRGTERTEKADCICSYAALLSPLTMLATQTMALLRSEAGLRSRTIRACITAGQLLLLAAVVMWYSALRIDALLFASFALMGLMLVAVRSRWLARTAAAALSLLLLLLVLGCVPNVPAKLAALVPHPVFTLSDYHGDLADIARYASVNTPTGAVFLTPPDWGQFRLLGNRAIVVDFKAFPFQDLAMVEWRQRLLDCYGSTASTGFAAQAEMDLSYRHITDPDLARLRTMYGVDYAVLHRETDTDLKVLYQTTYYKLVQLSSS